MRKSVMSALGATVMLTAAAITVPAFAAQKQCDKPVVNAYKMAVAYQHSAEVKALQLQAYNTAKLQLQSMLKRSRGLKAPAIMLDIDDTVLSNLPLGDEGLEECFKYDDWGQQWTDWVHKADAPLVAGAGSFLDYADAQGVKIFYVSNRLAENKKVTMKNLKKHGLPQVSKESVKLISKNAKTKTARKHIIEKKYDILMFFGDDLHDFNEAYDADTEQARRDMVTRDANKFGSRYILIPNAYYGTWTPGGDAWVSKHMD